MRGHAFLLSSAPTVAIGLVVGIWLSAPVASAGELRIAVTPGVVDAVEAVARVFETAYPDDHVGIVPASGAELKSYLSVLPVQLVASDDASLILWMEARELARPMHMFAVKRGQQAHTVTQRFLAFVSRPEALEAFRVRRDHFTQQVQMVEAATTASSSPSPSPDRH